jgi:hypothetical protein
MARRGLNTKGIQSKRKERDAINEGSSMDPTVVSDQIKLVGTNHGATYIVYCRQQQKIRIVDEITFLSIIRHSGTYEDFFFANK